MISFQCGLFRVVVVVRQLIIEQLLGLRRRISSLIRWVLQNRQDSYLSRLVVPNNGFSERNTSIAALHLYSGTYLRYSSFYYNYFS